MLSSRTEARPGGGASQRGRRGCRIQPVIFYYGIVFYSSRSRVGRTSECRRWRVGPCRTWRRLYPPSIFQSVRVPEPPSTLTPIFGVVSKELAAAGKLCDPIVRRL